MTLPNQRSIPWGVAGMLALVVGIEGFVASHWIALTDPVSLSWRYSTQAAESEARDCQLLCLGDSLVKHGLVPSVIERTSGQKAAEPFRRAGVDASDLLASFAVPSIPAPGRRRLIINAKPAVLLGGPEFNARPWQEVLGLRDAPNCCRITRNAPFVASTLVGRLLPSLRARLEIQSAVMAAIQGEHDAHPLDQSRPLAELDREPWGQRRLGRTRFQRRAEFRSPSGRSTQTFFTWIRPMPKPSSESWTLAAARRIPIYWVLCPLSPDIAVAPRSERGR